MTWHLVAHECELSRPGDFINVPWRDDGNLVVSNIGGEIVAWDGRCSHRGMNIHETTHGNAPPLCRYHNRCQKINNMRVEYRRQWKNGWLFVSDDTHDRLCEVELLGRGTGLRLYNVASYVYECNWAVAIENALEADHVPFVHAESLAKLQISRKALMLNDDGGSTEIFSSGIANTLDKISHLFHAPRVDWDYLHQYLSPYACLSSTRGWTWSLQNYWPRSDGTTAFMHRFYVTKTDRDMSGFFDSAMRLNERVFKEDAAIVARVPGLPYGDPEPSEERIAHFRAGCPLSFSTFM
jgi:phenylpropionate dioxygenase-like ring-hydroxylating dioxygenase large terminal subunit